MNDPLDDLLRTASDDLRSETDTLTPPDFEPRGQVGRVAGVSAVLVVLALVGGAVLLNRGDESVQAVDGVTAAEPHTNVTTETPTETTAPPQSTTSTSPEPSTSEPTDTEPESSAVESDRLPTAVDVGSLRTDREPVGLAGPSTVEPGAVYTDPVFGTEVLRLTDAAPGSTIVPGLVGTQVFNADGSLFILNDSSTEELILYRSEDLTEVRRLTLSGSDQTNFFWHSSAPDRLVHVGPGGDELVERSVTDDGEEVVASPACDSLQIRNIFGSDAHTDYGGFLCSRAEETFWGYLNMESGQHVVADAPIDGQPRAPLAADPDGTTFVAVENNQVIVLDGSLSPTPISPLPISAKAVAFTVDPATGRTVLVVTDYDSTDAALAAAFDLSTGQRTNIVAESEGDGYPPNGLRMSSASAQDLIAVAGRLDRDRALEGELMLLDRTGTVYRLAHHGMVEGDFGDLDDALVKLSPDQSVLLFTSNLGGDAVDTFVIRLD